MELRQLSREPTRVLAMQRRNTGHYVSQRELQVEPGYGASSQSRRAETETVALNVGKYVKQ